MTDIPSRSPFYIFQDFISQTEAFKIAKTIKAEYITSDENDIPLVIRSHKESETFIFNKLKPLLPKIEEYFGFECEGVEPISFLQAGVSNGKQIEQPRCWNAEYKRKRWVRVNERALTAILWLKDYQDSPPFNLETQVLGAKLEFPVYGFGFQPQAGTLIVYPANEKFISLTTSIQVGDLQQARIHFHPKKMYIYDHTQFPGDYTNWFSYVA